MFLIVTLKTAPKDERRPHITAEAKAEPIPHNQDTIKTLRPARWRPGTSPQLHLVLVVRVEGELLLEAIILLCEVETVLLPRPG